MLLLGALVLGACTSDPRSGGIFWSESGARKRLAVIQEQKNQKERELRALKSEIARLKRQKRALAASASPQTTAGMPASAVAAAPDADLESKEKEVRRLEHELKGMKARYGAMLY